jgi:hypothetical protein
MSCGLLLLLLFSFSQFANCSPMLQGWENNDADDKLPGAGVCLFVCLFVCLVLLSVLHPHANKRVCGKQIVHPMRTCPCKLVCGKQAVYPCVHTTQCRKASSVPMHAHHTVSESKQCPHAPLGRQGVPVPELVVAFIHIGQTSTVPTRAEVQGRMCTTILRRHCGGGARVWAAETTYIYVGPKSDEASRKGRCCVYVRSVAFVVYITCRHTDCTYYVSTNIIYVYIIQHMYFTTHHIHT